MVKLKINLQWAGLDRLHGEVVKQEDKIKCKGITENGNTVSFDIPIQNFELK